MGVRRHGLAIAVALGLLALSGPRLSARAEEPAGEPAFLASIEEAKAALLEGRGTRGLDLLTKALEAHKGQDYVRAKKAALEDLVKRLSFRCSCTPPEPQAVVKGRIKRYAP